MSGFTGGGGAVGALLAANNLSDLNNAAAAAKNLQVGYVLNESATQVSHTGDTTEFTFATITLPAGALGANGHVLVEAIFTHSANTDTKTPRIRFGGTQVAGQAVASNTGTSFFGNKVANRNAQNSQVFFPTTIVDNYVNGTSAALGTSAIDTSQAVSITITGQLGTGTDTISCEWYRVIVYPKA